MLTKVWWKDLPEIFKTDEKMVFDSINQDTLDRQVSCMKCGFISSKHTSKIFT